MELLPGEIIDRAYTRSIDLNRVLTILRKISIDPNYIPVFSDSASILFVKPNRGITFFHHANLFVNPKNYPFAHKFILNGVVRKLEKVDQVVTLSNFTKKVLQEYTRLNNIKVIYPYVNLPTPDMDLVDGYRKMYKPPIVLGVGTSIKIKNFTTLYTALSGTDMTVVRVGGAKTSGLPSNVLFLGEGNLTPTEISSIYAAADVLAFTSVDEGFGFPLIEAMHFGLPIVANRCTSIPEIVGDAAIFVSDPFDPDELYNAIKKALDNKKELSKKSYERSKIFSRDRYLRDIEQLFNELY